jgi:hypothetical protein
VNSTVNLREDGTASCSTYVHICGHYLTNFRDFLTDPATHIKIANEIFAHSTPDLEVDEVNSRFLPDEDSIVIEFAFESPRFAEVVNDKLLFAPNLQPGMESPFTKDYRVFPIDFGFAQIERQRTTVRLPEGWHVADIPTDIDHRIDGARVGRTIAAADGALTSELLLEIGKIAFLPAEYDEVKEMFDMMEKCCSDQVLAVRDAQE